MTRPSSSRKLPGDFSRGCGIHLRSLVIRHTEVTSSAAVLLQNLQPLSDRSSRKAALRRCIAAIRRIRLRALLRRDHPVFVNAPMTTNVAQAWTTFWAEQGPGSRCLARASEELLQPLDTHWHELAQFCLQPKCSIWHAALAQSAASYLEGQPDLHVTGIDIALIPPSQDHRIKLVPWTPMESLRSVRGVSTPPSANSAMNTGRLRRPPARSHECSLPELRFPSSSITPIARWLRGCGFTSAHSKGFAVAKCAKPSLPGMQACSASRSPG